MEYLVTGRQAKAIDTYTIEHTGIPSLVLMERASLTIAEETAQVAAQLKLPAVRIAAVCGSGNNGGDGIAAARILHSRGYDVTIFFAGRREKMSPDCQKQLSIAENLSVPISNDTDLDAIHITPYSRVNVSQTCTRFSLRYWILWPVNRESSFI